LDRATLEELRWVIGEAVWYKNSKCRHLSHDHQWLMEYLTGKETITTMLVATATKGGMKEG
jgi:hypothetical protein